MRPGPAEVILVLTKSLVAFLRLADPTRNILGLELSWAVPSIPDAPSLWTRVARSRRERAGSSAWSRDEGWTRASRSEARTTGARSGAAADWCGAGAAPRVSLDCQGDPSHAGHGEGQRLRVPVGQRSVSCRYSLGVLLAQLRCAPCPVRQLWAPEGARPTVSWQLQVLRDPKRVQFGGPSLRKRIQNDDYNIRHENDYLD